MHNQERCVSSRRDPGLEGTPDVTYFFKVSCLGCHTLQVAVECFHAGHNIPQILCNITQEGVPCGPKGFLLLPHLQSRNPTFLLATTGEYFKIERQDSNF